MTTTREFTTQARQRTRSHYQAILELLRERAEQGRGVLASELYEHSELFGRSPRNRVSELRRDGYQIEGRADGASDWFYRLMPDGKSRPTEPASDDLPLFAGVR